MLRVSLGVFMELNLADLAGFDPAYLTVGDLRLASWSSSA
jgi:hypothetical protein